MIEKLQSLISILRARFGRFGDGSSIVRISREEYLYKRADGHAANVYVFIILGDRTIGRSLDKASIEKWIEPAGGEPISIEEQREIVEKFKRYFRAYGENMEAE